MCSVPAFPATAACLFDDDRAARWPLPATRAVVIGGVTVTCAEALRACDVLAASGSCAIAAVLRAAGSPLAACDYHAVYRPGWKAARASLAATGRPGGAGRHAAKHAFAAAVREEVARACCRALEAALEAIASDERYAAAIARDAAARAAGSLLPPAPPEPAAGPLRLEGDETAGELAEAALWAAGLVLEGDETEQELATALQLLRAA